MFTARMGKRISVKVMLIRRMPMLHMERLRKYLVYAVLFSAVAAAHAAQDTGARLPPSSAGAVTAPNSDAVPFEIAPGIPLPPKGIVWILDKAEEKQELVRVSLNKASFNRHVGENVARTQFFSKVGRNSRTARCRFQTARQQPHWADQDRDYDRCGGGAADLAGGG